MMRTLLVWLLLVAPCWGDITSDRRVADADVDWHGVGHYRRGCDDMNVWVTRRPHNRYMLTHARPILCVVKGTDKTDAYAEPGDPLVVQDVCEWGVKTLWPDLNLQPLQSERRTLRGE